jgi:uroporphyrinogen-III synthase
MAAILLILRPQPGADETAARAAAVGLESVVAPLFAVTPTDWQVPDQSGFDALLFTSANAPRHAGSKVAALAPLPCYCVGEATAAEARKAGFAAPHVGPSDGNALLKKMADAGSRRILHLCGRDHVGLEHPDLSIFRSAVYAAEPVKELPHDARGALRSGALALIHSPRAGRLFGQLADAAGLDRAAIRIAAISEAAADAAGEGWALKAVAAAPRDQALLELAAKLCNNGGVSGTGMAR